MLKCLCKKRPTHAKKKDQLRDKILEDNAKYWKNKRKSNNLTKKAKQFQSKDRGKMPSVILCRENYCDHRSEKTRCFWCSRWSSDKITRVSLAEKRRSRKTETLLKRSLVLKSRDSVKHSIQSFRNSTKENRDTECILRFSFTKSEKLINLLSMSEGIGNVEFVFSETKVQQSASELSVVVIFYGHLGEVLSFE